ncbi:MAG: hypothetical protein ABWZ98_03970, partial [Nakamurella sp.]
MNEADPSIDRTDTAANGPGSEPDPALELMAAGQPQAAASSSGSAENARTVDVADPAIAPAPVMPTSTARQIDLPAADL